jgi:hypothetical protein
MPKYPYDTVYDVAKIKLLHISQMFKAKYLNLPAKWEILRFSQQ